MNEKYTYPGRYPRAGRSITIHENAIKTKNKPCDSCEWTNKWSRDHSLEGFGRDMLKRTRRLCRLEAKPAMKKAKASKGISNSKLLQKKHSNKNSGDTLLIDIKPPKVHM